MSDASPQDAPDKRQAQSEAPSASAGAPLPPRIPSPGMVGHVRVLCILSWVQGGLELMMGVLTCIGAVWCGSMLWCMSASGPTPGAPQTEEMWFIATVYALMAAVPLVIGLLRIYAALRNFRFQRRGMGIFALALGSLSLVSFYLGPTALALLIYGLVVLLDGQTRRGFEMGERGCTYDQIHATFWPHVRRLLPPQRSGALSACTSQGPTYVVFGEAEAKPSDDVVPAEVRRGDPPHDPGTVLPPGSREAADVPGPGDPPAPS